MPDSVTRRDEHALARWSEFDAVIAAYAGSRAGVSAFAHTCRMLRRALPDARVTVLGPAEAILHELEGIDGVIEFPSPSSQQATDAAAVAEALRAVDALAACGAQAALVFAESGHAPYAPAYLCYLAGIDYRAGFEAEFGGALLSPALKAPAGTDLDRHLALLAAVGLEPSGRPGTLIGDNIDAVAGGVETTRGSIGCDR